MSERAAVERVYRRIETHHEKTGQTMSHKQRRETERKVQRIAESNDNRKNSKQFS